MPKPICPHQLKCCRAHCSELISPKKAVSTVCTLLVKSMIHSEAKMPRLCDRRLKTSNTLKIQNQAEPSHISRLSQILANNFLFKLYIYIPTSISMLIQAYGVVTHKQNITTNILKMKRFNILNNVRQCRSQRKEQYTKENIIETWTQWSCKVNAKTK